VPTLPLSLTLNARVLQPRAHKRNSTLKCNSHIACCPPFTLNLEPSQEASAARDAAAAAKQQVALLLQAQGPADSADRDEVQQLQQQVAPSPAMQSVKLPCCYHSIRLHPLSSSCPLFPPNATIWYPLCEEVMFRAIVMIFTSFEPPAAHARAQETEALLLDKGSACTAAAAEVAGSCCCR
jgi:hypothetical protein